MIFIMRLRVLLRSEKHGLIARLARLVAAQPPAPSYPTAETDSRWHTGQTPKGHSMTYRTRGRLAGYRRGIFFVEYIFDVRLGESVLTLRLSIPDRRDVYLRESIREDRALAMLAHEVDTLSG